MVKKLVLADVETGELPPVVESHLNSAIGGATAGLIGVKPASVSAARAAVGTAVCMGDSNTANPRGVDIADGAASGQSTGWFTLMCMLSNGRIRHRGTYARASYTTAQVRDAKLAAVLALDPLPGACFIMLGTNDIGASSGAGFNLTAATAAYVDIITQMQLVGVLPIVVLPLPNNTNATVLSNERVWHRRLKDLADYYRLPLVDFYTPVLDPATGGILAAYAADTIHVNDLGRRVMAQAAIDQGIAEFFPPAQPELTAKSPSDAANILPNGNFLGGSTTGWSTINNGSGLATISQVAPAAGDKLVGMWDQIVHTGSAIVARQGSPTILAADMAGLKQFAPGDTLEYSCRIQTSGIEAAQVAGQVPNLYARIELRDATTTIGFVAATLGSPKFNVDIANGILRGRAVLPAGVDRLRVYIGIEGASSGFPITVRHGEHLLVNRSKFTAYAPA